MFQKIRYNVEEEEEIQRSIFFRKTRQNHPGILLKQSPAPYIRFSVCDNAGLKD